MLTNNCFCFCVCLFLVYLPEWAEREGASRGGAEKEEKENPKQAPHCQVECGAQTHELRDHDLSRSQTLSQLNHSGIPSK